MICQQLTRKVIDVAQDDSDESLISTFGRLVEAESRLTRLLGARLEAAHGLPLAWFEVLLRLSRSLDGRMTMTVLAEQISLTTGGVTRLVDRMQQAGLVERRPCDTDRRVIYAAVTPRGRDRLQESSAGHAAALREVFAPLGPAGRRTLDGLLDDLRTAPSDGGPTTPHGSTAR